MIKLNNSDRQRVARVLCAEILESEREKERLRERWVRLRAIHDCEESTSQVQLNEGMKPYVLPLSRAKADRIVSAVVDGITGIDPYVQVFDEACPNASLDGVERDLMLLAEEAGDEPAIREGTEDALITNTGVWRVRPVVGKEGSRVTRIDWQAIDPVDVCCYPPHYGTFAEAKTVGHRWSELLYRVKSDMREGRYFDVDLKGGDDPMRGHRTLDDQVETFEPQSASDEFVELWEVISELDLHGDGKYRRYLCVVALTEEKLLSIQPYPYSTPWYVEVRTERERNRIFPNSSVMQRLQGLQLAYSDMFTALIQASFASIGPITILTGGGLMSKVSQAKPFMMIEAPTDVKVQAIHTTPEVGALPSGIEKVEQVADALTGIARTGMGQQIAGSPTATEIGGLLQAQQDAKDSYTQVVADSVERVFRLIFEFYQAHYEDLRAAFGARLTTPAKVLRQLQPTFRINGRNGANNPTTLLHKLQMLLGIVGGMPQSPYDPSKVVEQIAQALDLPFSLKRLERDEPMAEILRNPAAQQLLMTGMPLPEILAALEGHDPSRSAGVLPPQPDMGADPRGADSAPDGGPAALLGAG